MAPGPRRLAGREEIRLAVPARDKVIQTGNNYDKEFRGDYSHLKSRLLANSRYQRVGDFASPGTNSPTSTYWPPVIWWQCAASVLVPGLRAATASGRKSNCP